MVDLRKLVLGAVVAGLLFAVSASPALAGPAIIGGSLKTGFDTFDNRITYGFEVEIMSYAVIQYMTAPGLMDFGGGYRFYIPIDKPLALNITLMESFRLNELAGYADYLTSLMCGIDYDGGWWFVGAEIGGGFFVLLLATLPGAQGPVGSSLRILTQEAERKAAPFPWGGFACICDLRTMFRA